MTLQDFALRLLAWRDTVLHVGGRYQLLGWYTSPFTELRIVRSADRGQP